MDQEVNEKEETNNAEWIRRERRREEIPGSREKVCMAMLWNKLWLMDQEGN